MVQEGPVIFLQLIKWWKFLWKSFESWINLHSQRTSRSPQSSGRRQIPEECSDIVLEICDTLSISPIQELVMQSAGHSVVWGTICIPPTSCSWWGWNWYTLQQRRRCPEHSEEVSSWEEDVLNILKKNSGGAKLSRRCEDKVPVWSRRDVD